MSEPGSSTLELRGFNFNSENMSGQILVSHKRSNSSILWRDDVAFWHYFIRIIGGRSLENFAHSTLWGLADRISLHGNAMSLKASSFDLQALASSRLSPRNEFSIDPYSRTWADSCLASHVRLNMNCRHVSHFSPPSSNGSQSLH